MLPLRWAGAQHSQSPVGAYMRNGDETSMLFRFAEPVVNIAHVPKRIRKQTSVSYAADGDLIACYGGARLADKHLASKIHTRCTALSPFAMPQLWFPQLVLAA
jgi:hypothetical protein